MAEKLGMKTEQLGKHYKVVRFREAPITHQCLVKFLIGKLYQDAVWCDVPFMACLCCWVDLSNTIARLDNVRTPARRWKKQLHHDNYIQCHLNQWSYCWYNVLRSILYRSQWKVWIIDLDLHIVFLNNSPFILGPFNTHARRLLVQVSPTSGALSHQQAVHFLLLLMLSIVTEKGLLKCHLWRQKRGGIY